MLGVMNPVETFTLADRAIEGVVVAVPDGGWARVPEPVFASDPIGGRPVRNAVAHLARDEAWIPSQLAGATMAEAGEPDVGPFPDLARRPRDLPGRARSAIGCSRCAVCDQGRRRVPRRPSG